MNKIGSLDIGVSLGIGTMMWGKEGKGMAPFRSGMEFHCAV